MTEDNYPEDARQRKVFRWIERRTMRHCVAAVFTTPSALRMYKSRYPHLNSTLWRVIENGYDEENFQRAEIANSNRSERKDRLTFVHSGILYPAERDPRQFFLAIAKLKAQCTLDSNRHKIVFRATGHDEYHQKFIDDLAIGDLVALAPGIPYEDALAEMLHADGLLLFQATSCNHQIPAKLYEYIRARRPIFAATDPEGDTAQTMRDAGVGVVAKLSDVEDLAKMFQYFVESIDEQLACVMPLEQAKNFSRERRSMEFASLLDEIIE